MGPFWMEREEENSRNEILGNAVYCSIAKVKRAVSRHIRCRLFSGVASLGVSTGAHLLVGFCRPSVGSLPHSEEAKHRR